MIISKVDLDIGNSAVGVESVGKIHLTTACPPLSFSASLTEREKERERQKDSHYTIDYSLRIAPILVVRLSYDMEIQQDPRTEARETCRGLWKERKQKIHKATRAPNKSTKKLTVSVLTILTNRLPYIKNPAEF